MIRSNEIRARLETPHSFGNYIDLRGITCEDPLDLDNIALTGVDFTGARFPQGISARGARFSGLGRFCRIEAAHADFTGAIFHSDARFDGARLAQKLVMREAEFRGVLQFDGAELTNGVDLSGAVGYGNSSFEHARMGGGSNLHLTEWLGGLWLESACFAQLETGDMLVHGRLWIRRARLADNALPPEYFSISFGYAYT